MHFTEVVVSYSHNPTKNNYSADAKIEDVSCFFVKQYTEGEKLLPGVVRALTKCSVCSDWEISELSLVKILNKTSSIFQINQRNPSFEKVENGSSESCFGLNRAQRVRVNLL